MVQQRICHENYRKLSETLENFISFDGNQKILSWTMMMHEPNQTSNAEHAGLIPQSVALPSHLISVQHPVSAPSFHLKDNQNSGVNLVCPFDQSTDSTNLQSFITSEKRDFSRSLIQNQSKLLISKRHSKMSFLLWRFLNACANDVWRTSKHTG